MFLQITLVVLVLVGIVTANSYGRYGKNNNKYGNSNYGQSGEADYHTEYVVSLYIIQLIKQ